MIRILLMCARIFPSMLLALGLTALIAVAGAQERPGAAPGTLKLSTAQGPAYPLGKAGEVWATLIRERSADRIAVTCYPGATLSSRDPSREFGALRDRAIDLAVGSTLMWSAQVPQLNVLALPWLVASADQMQGLLDGDVGRRLGDALASRGVVAVAWSENGFVDLASTMPVHKPADLAGLRLRAQASPMIEETLAALGARASAMSAVDARKLLDRGELDGEETSIAAYSAARLYAGPLSHLLLWQAHADVMVFAVNQALWNSWSEEDRSLVRDAAGEAARQARSMAQRLTGEAALARLGAQGAVVNRLTPAGKDAFREAARPVYDRWTPVVGAELVDAARSGGSGAPQPR
jgi:TRAP-type C4-dicarboxylate transport system substrate-binding protein